jgi:hypothetical protein
MPAILRKTAPAHKMASATVSALRFSFIFFPLSICWFISSLFQAFCAFPQTWLFLFLQLPGTLI